MKTYHSKVPIDRNPAKLERYTKQVSLYKSLFEAEYPNEKVKGLALMPLHVDYPTPKGAGNGTAIYSANSGDHQLYLNGEKFTGANPTLQRTVPIKSKQVEIMYEDLDDDAKSIAVCIYRNPNAKNVQSSTVNKPIASMTSITPKDYITPQLIEHMKSIGINVNPSLLQRNSM